MIATFISTMVHIVEATSYVLSGVVAWIFIVVIRRQEVMMTLILRQFRMIPGSADRRYLQDTQGEDESQTNFLHAWDL